MNQFGIFTNIVNVREEKMEKLTKENVSEIFSNVISQHEKDMVKAIETVKKVDGYYVTKNEILIQFGSVKANATFYGVEIQVFDDNFTICVFSKFGNSPGQEIGYERLSYDSLKKDELVELIKSFLRSAVEIAIR